MIRFVKNKLSSLFHNQNRNYDLSGEKLFVHLRIEINADCNRKCYFCPRTTEESRKNNKERMPTSTVLSIIDQSLEMGFKGSVGFNFFNEPTLDDRLFYFFDYALQKGLKTMVITNGDTLKKNKEYTVELFKRSNVNLSLYDYKDQEGREKLILEWKQYLRELGIAEDKLTFYGNYFKFGTRAGLVKDNRDKFGTYEVNPHLPLKAACKKFLTKINIRFDGEVALCTEDALCQCSLGNINQTSLYDIWYGKKRMEIARLLSKGKRGGNVPCNRCDNAPFYI